MSLKNAPLLTCGPGNAYLISILGKDIQDSFDPDTGLTVAFRVTWNMGHQLPQFPPFMTTLHDAGTFYFGTDASVEVVFSDSLVLNEDVFKPGTASRVAPSDTAVVYGLLSSGQFAVLVTPLALTTPKGMPGPLLGTMPLPGNLPPLTCKYRATSSGPKPCVYATHAELLRAGDTFRESLGAGGAVYTTPGQPVSVTDGITMIAVADGKPGQIRWLYGT